MLGERVGVVSKYYVYKAMNGPGFIFPIYVLYLLDHGVSFTEIGTIGAVQAAIIVAGEIPTGYIGDRVGRRNSLALGQTLYALSTLGLLFGETFAAFLLAFGVMSLGRTFISGSGTAWLYDILQDRLDESRFTHVRGRGEAIGQWMTAVTMIAGGALYVIGTQLPFVALFVMRIGTFLAVLWLPKTALYDETAGASTDEQEDGRVGVLEVVPILRERLTDPTVRSFVVYMTVVFGVVLAVDPFVQPIAVDTLESAAGSVLASVGVPEAATLGVLYASFTAVAATASDYAATLEEWLGLRTMVLLVPAAMAVLLVVPTVVSVLAIPMFFGVRGANALLRPVSEGFLHDQIESVGRATVLSAVSMAYGLGRIPFMIGSGAVADLASPLMAVAALGGVLVVCGGLLFAVQPPVDRATAGAEPVAGD